MNAPTLETTQLAHCDACDYLAATRTRFLQKLATPKELRYARRQLRSASQALINALYAVGREPSPYMVGALPRMYRSAQRVAR